MIGAFSANLVVAIIFARNTSFRKHLEGPSPPLIHHLSRGQSCVRPKGIQGVGNENTNAQYNDNSDDGPKHNSFLHERLQ
jgi:hypothetical protein